jgi:hypothetical protein
MSQSYVQGAQPDPSWCASAFASALVRFLLAISNWINHGMLHEVLVVERGGSLPCTSCKLTGLPYEPMAGSRWLSIP